MKKQLSLILALLVSLSCIFAFTGCDIAKENSGSKKSEVVATVGDEKIYLHEYEATYKMYVDYYANYGYDITTDAETLATFKTDLLKNMISSKAAIVKAKELGLDKYTEEQQQEIQNSIETEKNSIEEYYRPLAKEQAGSEDEAVIQAKFEELVAAESVNYTGIEMTYEEYMAYVEKSITDTFLINLYKNEVVYKDLSVSDEDVKAKYDEIVENDTKAYTETPADYKDAQESAELYVSIPTGYTPAGYSRILSLLITPTFEKSEKYTENETKMTSLKAEYGELAFEDAAAGTTKNAAKMKEKIDEYKKLKAANDAEYEAASKSFRDKANEAYAKLQGGAKFVDVMLEYGQDPDFVQDSIFVENGVLISKTHKAATDLSDEVKAEFAKLQVGQYSQVFEDKDGFHIIYYLADEKEGVRPYEELESFIKDDLLTDSKTTEWNTLIDEWAKDTTFVTINQELIDGVK